MSLVAQEIPKVGLVMEAVKVIRWLKNVGDRVAAGEPLLEVETEKSVVEIEAAATGRLSGLYFAIATLAAVGIPHRIGRVHQHRQPVHTPAGIHSSAVSPPAISPATGIQPPRNIVSLPQKHPILRFSI